MNHSCRSPSRALARAAARAAASTFLILLSACEEGATVPVEPAVYATPASIILAVGEQRTLPVTRVPGSAQFLAVSELPAVATVVQNPASITVTGVCAGFISIFLSLPAFPGAESDVVVEVTDDRGEEEPTACS